MDTKWNIIPSTLTLSYPTVVEFSGTRYSDIISGSSATLTCTALVISTAVNFTWSGIGAVTPETQNSVNNFAQDSVVKLPSIAQDTEVGCSIEGQEGISTKTTVDVFTVSGKGATVESGGSAVLTCTIQGELTTPFPRNRPNREILIPESWLADNQSRDLNNEFWLVVYLCRSVPASDTALKKV